jgi:hypothetical protein
MRVAILGDPAPWLKYVVAFIAANSTLDAEFRLAASPDGADACIAYGTTPPEGLPCVQIPVCSGKVSLTPAPDAHGILREDIFHEIFNGLSCRGEYDSESAGKPVRSLAARLRPPREGWKIPAASVLLRRLDEALADLPGLRPARRALYPQGKSFAICLTHDLDTLNSSPKTALKQTRHALVRSLKHLRRGTPGLLAQEIQNLLRKTFSGDRLWNLGTIRAMERAHGVNSTYNVYAKTQANSRGLKQALYNPEYDIAEHDRLRSTLAQLRREGDEIAVHGSYESAYSVEMLRAEINKIETEYNVKVSGGRQHFLQFAVPATHRLHAACGLEYDTSLGFRDLNGFRAGSCHSFFPYDHDAEAQIPVLQIPLVVMDGVLFDRDGMTPERAWEDMEQLLSQVRDLNGACSILWHNHVFDERLFPGWKEMYAKALTWIADNNGWMGPCATLKEHMDARRPA